MRTVALIGAGKIGETITALFAASGRYKVKVCDIDLKRAEVAARDKSCCEAHLVNLNDAASLRQLVADCEIVISALPFFCNRAVAQAAHDVGIHYADLTEDVETSKFIAQLSQNSRSCFMPQCGLAPGFISIAAAHLVGLLDSVDSLKLRVGALPMYPTNRLMYNLTWSTDGLINEYCNPCEVIQGGVKLTVPALEGLEKFSFDGDEYEAFNTSGGLGTLADALHGKVSDLTYKTIRYPGHRDLVSFLLHDLKFINDRDGLKQVFERSIPTTGQDKCIIFVEASGILKGVRTQKTYASCVYNQTVTGKHFSAIQITTAAGICAPIDLLLSGAIGKRSGFIRAEDISLTDFLGNEFGKLCRDDRALRGIS
jgi:saccharopine dehydrogenase-like NADP-dependent oxidoreductase